MRAFIRAAAFRLRGRGWRVPAYSGSAAALLMFVRLFVPHAVGMANNGDAVRLMCHLGAAPDSPPTPSAKWFFARFWYRLDPPLKCPGYPTSEILPMRATAWVHKHVLGLSGVVDLRELAVEYCVLVGLVIAGFALLLASVRLRTRVGLLCALFLVLSEATFADYAASPYSETAALWGLVVAALAGVSVVARTRYWRAAYILAWAAAVYAVGAKNETMTLAIPLALLLGTRRFELLPNGLALPARGGAILRRVTERVVPAACVLTLALTASWSLSSESAADAQINFGNELTMTIMPLSSDPDLVATELGLPASFGKYSGTTWWGTPAIHDDPQFLHYAKKFTDANLAQFFARNPVLSARVFAGGAPSYLDFRNNNLGTYPQHAGYAPESQECRDCVFESVSHALSWTGFAGIVAYWLACVGAAVWLIRISTARTLRRGFAHSALMLIGCTLIQYTTAVYGEGNEVTKHLVVGLFGACLAPVLLGAGALVGRPAQARIPQQPQPVQQPETVQQPRSADYAEAEKETAVAQPQ